MNDTSAPHQVDVYWSVMSQYCYFLLPRLQQLDARADVDVQIKPVRPGALRLPDSYSGRSEMERDYFDHDTSRTAGFLGMAYAVPDPFPVPFKPGTWEAADDQPIIGRLHGLLMASIAAGRGLEFLGHMMPRIWSGQNPGWDQTMEADFAWMDLVVDPAGYAAAIEANEAAMYASGHWGVPLMVYRDEPFYGQDRFDQLLWRIEGKA